MEKAPSGNEYNETAQAGNQNSILRTAGASDDTRNEDIEIISICSSSQSSESSSENSDSSSESESGSDGSDNENDSSSDDEDEEDKSSSESESSSSETNSPELIDLSVDDDENLHDLANLRDGIQYDNETYDPIIPLDCDDEEIAERLGSSEQMICNICSYQFKNRQRCIIHLRRHFAEDHFVCPHCSKGFIKLSQCQLHELKEHYNNIDENENEKNENDSKTYSLRSKIGSKGPSDSEVCDGNKRTPENIIPSSSLCPYNGPEITEMFQAYEIDIKFFKKERKISTQNTSKRILDHQKIISQYIAERVAENLRSHEEKAIKEKARADRGDNSKDMSARSPRFFPSRKKAVHSLSEDKCFCCSICDYYTSKQDALKLHVKGNHPLIDFRSVMKVIRLTDQVKDSTSAPCPSWPQPVAEVQLVEQEERKKHKLKSSHFNSDHRNSTVHHKPDKRSQVNETSKIRRKQQEKQKRDKSKKVKFAKRREAVRVWETNDQVLSQAEFMSALGMIRTCDVLLGPRQGSHHVQSSLFSYRRIRREKSPPPHAKIIMDKLPLQQTKHNRVHLCTICDFVSPSIKCVRRHRRSEHLKTSDKPSGGVENTAETAASSSSKSSNSPYSKSAPIIDISSDDESEDIGPKISFSCKTCNFTSVNRNEVKKHRKLVHAAGSDISLPSTSLTHSSPDPELLPKSPSEPVLYQCGKCTFSSDVKREVKSHIKLTCEFRTKKVQPLSQSSSNNQIQRLNNHYAVESSDQPPRKRLRFNCNNNYD